MQKRIIQVGLQGMNLDVINPNINSKQAYEIKNFRINSTANSNSIELTSEKGTLLVRIKYNGHKYDGILELIDVLPHDIPIGYSKKTSNCDTIGYCVLGKHLTVFARYKLVVKDDGSVLEDITTFTDYILRLDLDEDNSLLNASVLYYGNLGFDKDHRIETVPCYESEKVQKVYWIDGKNYPRVINIAREGGYLDFGVDDDPFSFYQKISDSQYDTITVEKSYVGGLFYAGVIQYAYSFYNLNAQETPVIYVTPLNYVSHSDRGEEPNKLLGCAFDVTVNIGVEDASNFDYVRVYSIYRTSLNGTPQVKVVKDIKCDQMTLGDDLDYYFATFTDTNEGGYDFDAYRILINSDHIKPNAIAHKDYKMFLGNYKTDKTVLKWDLLKSNNDIVWQSDIYKTIQFKDSGIQTPYNYKSQIWDTSNHIKTFKQNEYYKLGIQFQDKYGEWTSPFLVETTKNDASILTSGDSVKLPYAKYTKTISALKDVYIDDSETTKIGDLYVAARPVASFPTVNERTILCQGILNPTVFNSGMRKNGSCYALSSWFFRPFCTGNTIANHIEYVEAGHNNPVHCSAFRSAEIQSQFFDNQQTWDDQDDIEHVYHTGGYNSLTNFLKGVASGYTVGYLLNPLGDDKFEIKDSDDRYFINQRNYNVYYTYNGILNTIEKAYMVGKENYSHTFFYVQDVYEVLNDPSTDYIVDISGNTIGNYVVLKKYSAKVDLDGGVYTTLNYDDTDIGSSGSPIQIESIEETNSVYMYISGANASGYDIYASGIPQSSTATTRPYTIYGSETTDAYNAFYFIDRDVQTFNSPELDFDKTTYNIDLSQYDLRVVGNVPFNNLNAKYNIIAESQLFLNNGIVDSDGIQRIRSAQLAYGFHDRKTEPMNVGGRTFSTYCGWIDDICNIFTWDGKVHCGWNDKDQQYLYAVYPWLRQYLNNFNNNVYRPYGLSTSSKAGITEESSSSRIIKKVLSNLRISNNTQYLTPSGLTTQTIKLFNSNEAELQKLDNDRFYSGNVDQLVTCNSEYKGDGFLYQDSDSSGGVHWYVVEKSGYPIMRDRRSHSSKIQDNNWLFNVYTNDVTSGGMLRPMNYKASHDETGYKDFTPSDSSTDPIMIRYKSNPHIVATFSSGFTTASTFDTQVQCVNDTLPLCEIYRNYASSGDVPYVQCDDYESSITERTWIVAGEPISFNEDNDSEYLKWTEGDTYYQRYDCLKTYPFSNDDYQSVVEIASFMVETHVNLDGRYDENRGLYDNTYVNPTNFNLINDVYSLMNNFYQYNVLDQDRFNVDTFPTRLTWSLNKINNQEIDEWTRTNTAAFIDLDGDKGQISSLRRFNNQIYAFQESGISRIKYNENVVINASNGTPIELGNSASVNGKDYISETVGSQNKWSCISTPNGIFFVDNNTAGIYRLSYGEHGVGLNNITKDVLQRWFESNNKEGFVNNASYDANMEEVLFTYGDTSEQSLAYSNRYGIFSSFYDYQGWIDNIGRHSFNIYDNRIWFLREDDSYNVFYKNNQEQYIHKPYWIAFVANALPDVYNPVGCIYDNVWYNADVLCQDQASLNYNELIETTSDVIPNFSSNSGWYETFNKIEVGNDYQYAYSTDKLKFVKKFRMWRVPIPRQDRTRMRNPWLRIRMENENPSTDKMILRDIYVDSFF